MKNILIILCLTFVLTGCVTSTYTVKKSSDSEFADKNAPELVTLEANHIDYEDPMGIIPSSELIPYAYIDKSGDITETGFHLVNVRSNDKWLNVRNGDQIVFLADGERITAMAKNTHIDHVNGGYNSLTQSVITYYYDYAWYPLLKGEMGKISNAKSIKIQVVGQDGISEYGTKNSAFSINDSFYKNNSKFYKEIIMNPQM